MSAGKYRNRALFLDRDGIINRDYGYVHRRKDFHFIDGIFELTAAAVRRGFLPIIVTNQSGIGRGYYSERQFNRLMRWVRQQFSRHHAPVAAVYFCPCHPQHGIGRYRRDSFLRKPHPGMLLKAARDFRLDMARSVLVGDSVTDMDAGLAAGTGRLFYLNPDRPLPDEARYTNILCPDSLPDIVRYLDF